MYSAICLTLTLAFELVGLAGGSLENEELGHLLIHFLISEAMQEISRHDLAGVTQICPTLDSN